MQLQTCLSSSLYGQADEFLALHACTYWRGAAFAFQHTDTAALAQMQCQWCVQAELAQ